MNPVISPHGLNSFELKKRCRKLARIQVGDLLVALFFKKSRTHVL